jgi:uncharacterized protein
VKKDPQDTIAEIVEWTAAYVRKVFAGESSGHDWWHTYRVWRMARRISEEEGLAGPVVELSALLHDIADWKFHDGDMEAGPRAAHSLLASLDLPEETIRLVCENIRHISFKGEGEPLPQLSPEAQIVQDADRLDALGAIGIARTFAYGGFMKRMIHDPDTAPIANASFEEYKRGKGTTLNHFHEKLLLLRDRMNTRMGRRIAEERHAFMEEFLKRFHMEWQGG